MKDNKLQNLYIALLLYAISIAAGMIGYTNLESYSNIDAFYMTVMTLSTVGFGEINVLSDNGKIFTSIFILYNLCILAFVLSVISRYLFEDELKSIFNNYMSDREIKKMEGHVIVCGYGRNGHRACQELKKDGYTFVVIDSDLEHLKNNGESDLQYIVGDATDEKNLKAAGIDKAHALITAIPKDALNVFVTLTARELNKNLFIIARATEDSTISKLKTAGADKVVLLNAIGGRYMADLVSKPQVLDFLDVISGADGDLSLVKIQIENLKPEYKNKTIAEFQSRTHSDVNILSYKTENNEYIFNPPADLSVGSSGALMILGENQSIQKFKLKYTIETL